MMGYAIGSGDWTGAAAYGAQTVLGGIGFRGKTLSFGGGRTGAYFRNGSNLPSTLAADTSRMLAIAKRQAARLGIDPGLVHAVKDLGGSATGATLGGKIVLDPRAFRRGFDARLTRNVSGVENLKRTLIHEYAHTRQAIRHSDLYWSGTAQSRATLERAAYRFEDFYYGALQRRR